MTTPLSGAARAIAIGLALIGAAKTASALGYEEALTLAEQQSPALAAQQAALAGAEAARPAATALPDPKLSVGIDNLPISGSERGSLGADFMTMRRIALMQDVPNAAKRAARGESAQARADRERAALAAARQQVHELLARSWLTLKFIAQRQHVLADLKAENGRLQDTLAARIAAGTAQAADLLMARQEALALADRHDDLDRDETKARAMLQRLVGPRATEPLQGEPPVAQLSPMEAREQVPHHAELDVYPAMIEQARAELKEAQAESRSDWSWEVAYGKRGAQWGDMVSFQVSFGLPWQKQRLQQPQIMARQKAAERLESEQEDMLRQHRQTVDEQLAEIASLDRQFERLQGDGLRLAHERVALALAAYEGGKADLGGVLGARRELLEARMRAVDLDARRTDVRAQLAYLTMK